METLGLSDSTPRSSESRLKSLLWPSVQNGVDVDYLGTQGFWVATLVAALTFALSLIAGLWITGLLMLLFFFLGAVGIRERSRYAAVVVFILYAVDTIFTGLGVVRIILGALLLSNVRATFIAARWTPGAEEAAIPPRLGDTLGDRFSDQLPVWLWPKIRVPYYIFSAVVLAVVLVGAAVMIAGVR